MAVHYEVEEGKSLVIDGPANVIVKTGGIPIVGTGARSDRKLTAKVDVDVEVERKKPS